MWFSQMCRPKKSCLLRGFFFNMNHFLVGSAEFYMDWYLVLCWHIYAKLLHIKAWLLKLLFIFVALVRNVMHSLTLWWSFLNKLYDYLIHFLLLSYLNDGCENLTSLLHERFLRSYSTYMLQFVTLSSSWFKYQVCLSYISQLIMYLIRPC